jgi:hypothetical protein
MTTSDFLDLKLARLSAFVGAGKGLRAAVYSALAHIRDFVLIESIDFNDARLTFSMFPTFAIFGLLLSSL